jgi:cytochrome c peroxidase
MLVIRSLMALGTGCALLGATAWTVPAEAAEGETLRSGEYTLVLPLGLEAGSAFIPEENPLSADKITLGKFLYFDDRLSKDGTISCASCHRPEHGFADRDKTSKGVGGGVGARNSPTVINRLFSAEQFWDGRAKDLEDQAHGPLTNPVEMAMGSHDEVVANVQAVAGYKPLFAKAFGSEDVTMPRIAQAIASYERTVLAGNSPFDRYRAGDPAAMSEAAVRGMAVFNGKGNCMTCHAGFNFTDESYHNLGVGMGAAKPDLGRYEQTKQDADRGAFKTPTLRNVTQNPPYMHDGSEATLALVVEFYDRGGAPNQWLSGEVKPLALSATEKADLVAFLQALTGDVTNADRPAALPK